MTLHIAIEKCQHPLHVFQFNTVPSSSLEAQSRKWAQHTLSHRTQLWRKDPTTNLFPEQNYTIPLIGAQVGAFFLNSSMEKTSQWPPSMKQLEHTAYPLHHSHPVQAINPAPQALPKKVKKVCWKTNSLPRRSRHASCLWQGGRVVPINLLGRQSTWCKWFKNEEKAQSHVWTINASVAKSQVNGLVCLLVLN